MVLFSANNIVKKYANHTALNNVSIEVDENCVFGLLGPNGAGKTSLIRIINQITAPDSGTLFFNGEKLSEKHIGMMGYLPEERGLYKKMELGEQALYLAQLKGLSEQEAKEKLKYWFEKFEIQSWWKKKIEDLSKGMQQKVQFIISILHQPKLLILDEPFSGFDPINANLIKNEILELKKNGTTIILSTHNMGSVEELCDNIALINKSEKVLGGNVKEIRKKYSTNVFDVEFKGSLLSFTNSMWGGFEVISHKKIDEFITARIKLINGNTPNTLLKHILDVVEVHSLNEIIPTMNDIFIASVTGAAVAVADLTE
jgi:ABC-2 type transport system ATP-binding protein